MLAAQTGLRVSELTGLTIDNLHLGTGAHVYCRGKGRKDQCTPLTTHTAGILTEWLDSTPTTITAIDNALRTPPLDLAPRPRRDPNTSRTPQPPTRRHRVMSIMSADPPPRLERQGTRRAAPGQAPQFLTQLGEWTRLGFLTRIGAGTYALDTPP